MNTQELSLPMVLNTVIILGHSVDSADKQFKCDFCAQYSSMILPKIAGSFDGNFFKVYSKHRKYIRGYEGAASVLMLESAAKASASMLGTASNYRQSQTFTKVCLDHGAMFNESCTPIPHFMRSDVDLHAASPVARNKRGRVQDLVQHKWNVLNRAKKNGKIKEIAEKQNIQIIALQETKLNEKYKLKYKNYNILRKDRNKEEGGLAFLIKNLYYEDIAMNIPNTSDLEAQEISTKTKTSSIKEKFWNFKKANWNIYQQNAKEYFGIAHTRIKYLKQNWISFKNSIIKAVKVSIPRALIIFSMKKINVKELDYALENTDLNKTPGLDGIHSQMISNLGKNDRQRLLDIFNNSWKTVKLPQDWKTATIIPIKELDKSADDPKKLSTYLPHRNLLQINGKKLYSDDSPTTSTQEISYQKKNMD
ncbi:hypothetical protein LAZ67_7001716 [Cordylochernes scorpioides]|uniref:Uncharacterized protein n=1 Tax=Cordylochernes scorpioides TaxID=51811 RepID=A0ABY6KQR2_9ARAC|nr:hypothetical protein LAZ67_7001716 [Cordylochernes scorpioides]